MDTKNFLKVVFVILIIENISFELTGQDNEKRIDSLNYQISQEDLIAVLQTLNIEVHKYKVNFPKEQKCNVFLYVQEYEKRNKIKDVTIWGSPNPFRWVEDGKEVQKTIEQIRIITKRDKQEFTLNMKMGDFSIQYYIKIDTLYKKPHACKPFKLPKDYPIGSKIPLLLIGSYWDATSRDGTMKTEKFCMENELDPDFSSRSFDVMPHYFVFGISIEKQDE